MMELQTLRASVKIVKSASTESLIKQYKKLIASYKRILRTAKSKNAETDFTGELSMSAFTDGKLVAELCRLGDKIEKLEDQSHLVLFCHSESDSLAYLFGSADFNECNPEDDFVFESNMKLAIKPFTHEIKSRAEELAAVETNGDCLMLSDFSAKYAELVDFIHAVNQSDGVTLKPEKGRQVEGSYFIPLQSQKNYTCLTIKSSENGLEIRQAYRVEV